MSHSLKAQLNSLNSWSGARQPLVVQLCRSKWRLHYYFGCLKSQCIESISKMKRKSSIALDWDNSFLPELQYGLIPHSFYCCMTELEKKIWLGNFRGWPFAKHFSPFPSIWIQCTFFRKLIRAKRCSPLHSNSSAKLCIPIKKSLFHLWLAEVPPKFKGRSFQNAIPLLPM